MRLKIATKIALGFGLVVIAVLANGILTQNAIQRNQEVNETITNVYAPSLEWIKKLQTLISDSRMLVKSWVHIDKISDTPDKLRLRELHTTEYPMVMDTLQVLSGQWTSDENSEILEESKELLKEIDAMVADTLFPRHQYIMSQLSSFESYDDPFIVFEVTPMTEEGGEVMEMTERILDKIAALQSYQEEIVNRGRK